ncbi:hypothetical protein Syun_025022 [Stephania yunnanensis]|uniref:Uncharacterized protein n=1 Tax=Stephania yunnanensis TaxID=152371 RepID=A0AAP0HUI1_9MAGN
MVHSCVFTSALALRFKTLWSFSNPRYSSRSIKDSTTSVVSVIHNAKLISISQSLLQIQI